MADENEMMLHSRQVDAVAAAVAKLLMRPEGFTPEAIFEGAVRGGAVALLSATPATAVDVGRLLETMGQTFRDLDKPHLHVVR
ncbi:hypothetical protein EN933_02260 [Mesorhizobium sp. M7A.F.Ca.US.001.01.1.1]|nr:hypothetical protein EN933_02260 [Mesorhizobium sp. M7A.F.Ca.US.001.01.1.1]